MKILLYIDVLEWLWNIVFPDNPYTTNNFHLFVKNMTSTGTSGVVRANEKTNHRHNHYPSFHRCRSRTKHQPKIVKASDDNDLVEVTTQACGIKGFGNTTVKLTREQYQNLEQYLVEFRQRLNQTSTREEAVPIFKEAVVELDKYGLLPKGMSVEKAQRLVIGAKQNHNQRS